MRIIELLNRAAPQIRKRKTVEPIKDPQTIARLRESLRKKPRDLLLFDLATQTGLGMKQIISLKVNDLSNLKIGDELPVDDRKYDHLPVPVMNECIYRTFHWYLEKTQPKNGDFLFKSRKGSKPLTLTSVSHLVRKWFDEVQLKDLSGASSLKKTWEFHRKHRPEIRLGLDNNRVVQEVLKPVATATLQEAVYGELKQAILSGRIPPGEKLFTDQIAKQTNVSETPAREALARLEAVGFISRTPRKGYIVQKLSSKDLREICKIRKILETMATREALGNISLETLQYLEDIFEQYKQAKNNNNIEKYFLLNREFHHTIYSAAHMPTLKTIIDILWDKMSPYLNLLVRECEDYNPQVPWECHRGMLDGITNQDPNEACKWLENDLTRAAETLTGWLDRQKTT